MYPQVNLADSRFKKMLVSSEFAIDPTDPAFKRTKGADSVMKEVSKLKRSVKESSQHETSPQNEGMTPNSQDLDSMVKKLKKISSVPRKRG